MHINEIEEIENLEVEDEVQDGVQDDVQGEEKKVKV